MLLKHLDVYQNLLNIGSCSPKCIASVITVVFYCRLPAHHALDSSMEHPALAFAAGCFHALKHHPVYFLSPLLGEAGD